MIRRPPRSTRTDTLFPYTTLFRLHATSLNADAPVLAAWATIAGVRAGDRLRLSLYAPDGRIVATDERALDRTQIRYFMFVGRRATRSRWPGGDYLAAVELARGDGVGAIRRTAEGLVPVRCSGVVGSTGAAQKGVVQGKRVAVRVEFGG